MVKKFLRGVFTAVIVLAVIWAAMAVTDYLRCRLLKEPVFVRHKFNQNSRGSNRGCFDLYPASGYLSESGSKPRGFCSVRGGCGAIGFAMKK